VVGAQQGVHGSGIDGLRQIEHFHGREGFWLSY
jgi:hypothetical protein